MVEAGGAPAPRHLFGEAWAVLRDLWHEWRGDRLSGLAGEVAFFNVLSLFPALVITAATLGSLERLTGGDLASRAEERIVRGLRQLLSDEAAGTIDAVESLFADPSAGALTFGVVATMWTASRGFTALVNAMHVVYNLTERRGYARLRVLAFLLAAGSLAVIVTVLWVIVLGPLYGGTSGAGGAFSVTWQVVRWPVVAAMVIAWAATLFHYAPNHRTPWRWDLPGALLTAVLWAVFSVAFRIYLSFATESDRTLGVLGGVLIVLLWQYLLALGLLLGGELNAVLANRYGVEQLPRHIDRLTPYTERAGQWSRAQVAALRRRRAERRAGDR